MAVQMTSSHSYLRGTTHALRFSDGDLLKLSRDPFEGWTLEFKSPGLVQSLDGYITKDEVERNFIPRDMVDEDYISKVNLKDMLETRFKKLMEMGESAANRNYYADASRYYGAAGQIRALIRDIDLEEIDQP